MSLFTSTASWVTDEHRMFAEMAGRFMDDELAPNIETWVDNGVVDRDFWRKAGETGLMAGAIDEEYGGVGGGMGFDAVTIYEQTSRGDAGWGYGIQSIVTHYITAYASEESGELMVPLKEGRLQEEQVETLGHFILSGREPERGAYGTTFSKAVGMALFDLTTARLAYANAVEKGVGTQL